MTIEIDEAFEAGDVGAVVALARRVTGRDKSPATIARWRELARGRPERVLRLLDASGVAELRAYSLEGPAPRDYRTRMFVQEMLRAVARIRHAPGLPLLMNLVHAHPSAKIRTTAAHALISFGTDEALERVAARRGAADAVERRLALRACFLRAPDRAYDDLGAPALDPAALGEVFFVLIRGSSRGPGEARRAGWLHADERWAALALSTLRGSEDQDVRALAKQLLGSVDPGVAARLRGGGEVRAPRPSPRPPPAALAAEIDRLAAGTPVAHVADRLAALEAHVGLLPGAVRAWYLRVGDAVTPLAPLSALEADAEDAAPAGEGPADEHVPALLYVVPDPLAAAGFSAGPGAGVRATPPEREPALDPPLEGDPDGLTFLERLRRLRG